MGSIKFAYADIYTRDIYAALNIMLNTPTRSKFVLEITTKIEVMEVFILVAGFGENAYESRYEE